MAITARAEGTWATLTADGAVTIPGSPVAGDMMYLLVAWKPFGTTAQVTSPANWTEITEFTDGAVANGNGVGSVKVAAYYKVYQAGDTNPTVDFSASPDVAGAVIVVFQKSVAETWDNPSFVTAAMTNWTTTSQTVTASTTPRIMVGDLIIGLIGIRDDSATMTRPTTGIAAGAITFTGNYVEYPSGHLSTTTGFDLAVDAGYRIASSSGSAAPTMTGTLSAAETGAALWIINSVTMPGYGQAQAFITGFTTIRDTFTRSVSNGLGQADVGGNWTPAQTGYDVNGSVATITSAASYIQLVQSIVSSTAFTFSFDFSIPSNTTGALTVGSLFTGWSIKVSAGAGQLTVTRNTDAGGSGITVGAYTANDTWRLEGQFAKAAGGTGAQYRYRAYKIGNPTPNYTTGDVTSTVNTGPVGLETDHNNTITLDNLEITNNAWTEFGQAQACIKQTYPLKPYDRTILKDAPVAYLPLGETGDFPQDIVGSADITAKVGTPTYGVTGPLSGDNDTGVTFDGVNEEFTIPNNTALDFANGPMSIELWAKRDALSGATVLQMIGRGLNGWAIGFSNTNKFYFGKQNVGQIVNESGSSTDLTDWHHYVATHNGAGAGNNKVYKDGIDVSAFNADQTIVDVTATIEIGSNAVNGWAFQGSLAKISVYNYILNQEQVTDHFSAASTTASGSYGQAEAKVAVGGATTYRMYAQSQTQIQQTYRGYAQSQADIKAIGRGYGQSQAEVKQTYNSFAQSQANIKQTYRGYGQAQACVKGNAFGQAQADIKQIYQGYAQSQVNIKATYNVFAQSQGTIKTTYNTFAQAQADIKVITNKFAQAQSWIEVTVNQFAQVQADIKQVYNSFAQSQTQIKQTYRGYAQAQSDIKQTYRVYSQARADIKATSRGYAQANADIKQTYQSYGQAQANISTTYNTFAQSQADIKITLDEFAQAQAKINAFDVQAYAQVGARIGGGELVWIRDTFTRTDTVLGIPDIGPPYDEEETGNFTINGTQLVVSDGSVEGTSYINAYNTTNSIEFTITSSPSEIVYFYIELYTRFAAANDSILLSISNLNQNLEDTELYIESNSDNASINIGTLEYDTTYVLKLQALNDVISGKVWKKIDPEPDWMLEVSAIDNVNGRPVYFYVEMSTPDSNTIIVDNYNVIGSNNILNGQAQAQIKQTYRGYGQSQADIKTTYQSYGQAQADIKKITNVYSQAQADIKQIYQGYGQAQSGIKAISNGYGQSQADIKQTYNAFAQAQGYIKVTDIEAVAQAQAQIKQTYQVYGQANARIIAFGVQTYGQAQGNVRFNGASGHGQTQAKINAFNYPRFAQAQAWIETTTNQHGQSQADIKVIYNGYGQAKSDILQTYQGYGQSQVDIKQTYQAYGQAQAHIVVTNIESCGQAQVAIKKTYNSFAQAQGTVKSTVSSCGQAQAAILGAKQSYGQAQGTIKAAGRGYGQTQSDVKATSNGYGQSQSDIKVTTVVCGQANAQIVKTAQSYGQANASIKAISNGYGQVNSDILVISQVYGQAQGTIKQVYQSYAQANAQIILKQYGFGQAATTVEITSNVCGQAQAQIKQTYNKHANAQGHIRTNVIKVAQAQAQIKLSINAYGQSQALITSGTAGYAQAQALILTTVNVHAQAQAVIIKASAFGQTQAFIHQPHTLADLQISDEQTLAAALSDSDSMTETDDEDFTITVVEDFREITVTVEDEFTLRVILSDSAYI